MNVNQPPAWSKSNLEIFKQFLESGTGEMFLAHVAFSRPSLLTDSADPNAVALKAQLVGGYEKCLNTILSLAVLPTSQDEPTSQEWPDLDRPAEPGELAATPK